MAAPTYTTDLTLINAGEATTNWTEPTGATVGGIAVAETDFFIQGTGCISKTFNGTGLGGLHFNNGAGVTIPTDGAYMAWTYFGAPNAIDTEANGGMRLTVGSGAGDYKAFYVRGSDTYPYGGWNCIPVDPTLTADATQGSPTSTRQYFGMVINAVNAVAKGNPFGIDALRYGRCEARIADGSTADGYATFNGYAATNDSVSNRWGLIQAVQGGYLMQGLCILGYAAATDFRDSNKVMLIANTKKVSANFNAIEVRNASTRVDMTAITFIALGTVSRGNWITTDNADINLDACSFTDMGTFSFLSASTILNSVFRRTDLITQGGAVFDGCTIDVNRASVAMLVSNLNNIDNCAFISDGTGHGIELTSAHAGGSYTLAGTTFTGYAGSDGSTGNEAIYNNSGGAVTINITNGGTTPSIRNGAGASTTVVAGSVTVSVNVKNTAGSNVQSARVLIKAATGGPFPFETTVTIANSGTTATVTHTGHGLSTNDKVLIKGASHAANNGVFSITNTGTNTYTYTMASAPGSNPTGTIKATFVVLEGLTDANGNISASRVYASDQPISGWARKSSAAPYYKPSAIGGTVNNASGLSVALQLIPDE